MSTASREVPDTDATHTAQASLINRDSRAREFLLLVLHHVLEQ